MQAGNAIYETIADLPPALPVFPLSGALLLPRTQLPLNIFEQRYIDMVDAALAGNRLIGMVQPLPERLAGDPDTPDLASVGCVGRLTSFQETGDGRYLITLQGITRFALGNERKSYSQFREVECDFAAFANDLRCGEGEDGVDRNGLLKTLRSYLDANNLEADWQSVSEAETEVLVNALCMMCPYGPQEKQALLEARDLRTRAETLIAITEMDLAKSQNDGGSTLQ
ncbi:Lon protease 2 [Labrenzia sp. THAF82]|uniref:LON peptidase substrate-binding domain-containing protein n=1 Tax=Labrenzia sp. THAF82 TaxID=2587861 RepID=UPI0012687277|nr:LON peptidase substrate-binding domain-containing protein [Labrenzia sp. THAF82]QFT29710.1 Lon protease 2 [Labrenzia sp. THAF82]